MGTHPCENIRPNRLPHFARSLHRAPMAVKYPFLSWTNSIFDAWYDEWSANERRLSAGFDVLEELARWDYEKDDSPIGSYATRKSRAVFVPYPSMMTTAFVGGLQREKPEPGNGLDFGTLGDPKVPSPAQDVMNSVDRAVGGASWDTFWANTETKAMATGHVWITCDAPIWRKWALDNDRNPDIKPNREDERNGFRPYLMRLSPLQVPDWHYDEYGVLQYLRWTSSRRAFKDGKTSTVVRHHLMVRRGCTIFGEPFSGGGTWLFEDDELVLGDDGKPVRAEYPTREIPCFPHFACRDESPHHAKPTKSASEIVRTKVSEERIRAGDQYNVVGIRGSAFAAPRPRMSRPLLTEIGQLAVQQMDTGSSAHNDVQVSGQRKLYVAGGDKNTSKSISEQTDAGSLVVVVPAPPGTRPSIHDTGSVTSAKSQTERQRYLDEQAREIMMPEATSAPQSSGESKKAGYREGKAPTLALMADELETSQTSGVHLLERGYNRLLEQPTGKVKWSGDFDLEPLVKDIEQAFDMMGTAGARSAKLTGHLVRSYLDQKGLTSGMTEDEIKEIVDELIDSIREGGMAAARSRSVEDALLLDAPEDPSDEDEEGSDE